MDQAGYVTVKDRDGITGIIENIPRGMAGDEEQVMVRLEDERVVLVPIDHLVLLDDGNYTLSSRLADFSSQERRTREMESDARVVPVYEEELHIGKRTVERGKVRVTKVVREHEEVVEETLLQERVEVTRVPINEMIDAPVSIRYEGDTMIIPMLEEVLVVEKRLMLKEELHITKQQSEIREPQTVTLRSEEATVERLDSTDT